VTGLAGLRIQIPAGGNCGRITGEWILYRIGRIRALRDPDFLYVALDKAACAAFVRESRMNFANANQFHRKSGDHYPGAQTYRRNPKITTSSPDQMQPTPSFMDHLLWSSLLVCPDFL
jgi:hypothetical protein